MLRTHDLEVQQRKNKKSSKAKTIALNVEAKSKGKTMKVSRRKSRIDESDPDDSSSDTDGNPDANTDDDSSDSDMEEMVAMIVRSFKKMKFRKARRQGNFQKRTFNTDKHIKKESKGSKFDKSKVRCYKCNGMGHFASECKKTKALITSSKDWMDSSSESDTEVVNYALMANTDDTVIPDDKVLNTIFDFDTDNASELRRFLKSLHISFRSQTAENSRILSEMSELRKRIEQLEAEFFSYAKSTDRM
ncbi:hypothetical protein POM88_008070 [Heracleum sosnowskyi]|uniref:CCHC-type domain-containing protein n=1 Tax=Heracleum sosnowskyi TaxID=360622 RepID=A0AAD8N6X8_9APIA|nr:hypothetical protein POM88_008070 [Heracleum sosnowskyi]